MKKIQLGVMIIIMSSAFCGITSAQLINIQRFIGRSQIDLINELGTPVHFDDSNPSMMYMSYNLLSLKCTADQNGIYKIELTRNYTSEKEAYEDVIDFIACSGKDGFISDSISAKKYFLANDRVFMEIILKQVKDNPYIELTINASRKSNE